MITIDYITGEISVEQADLVYDSTNPITGIDVYTLDIVLFGKALADIQDDSMGIWAGTAYEYTAAKNIGGGVILAPILLILSPYTITFEDLGFAVKLTGGNTNIQERTNPNTVSVYPNNTAGLVLVTYPTADLTTVLANQEVINTGVKKSSKLIPHNTDL